MVNYNKNEPLISLHVPKCGGTSFESVLKSWFGLGLHKHYKNHVRNIAPRKATVNLWFKNIVPVCIHGHFDKKNDNVNFFDYYPNANQFITLYRDPLELQLSYYFYNRKLFDEGSLFWQGKKVEKLDYLGKDVDEHLEELSDYKWLTSFVPWELNLNNYKDVIAKNFIHIGITEELQKSVDIMAQKLGKKTKHIPKENATKRKGEAPSESSIKKFKEKHALEYAFYDYACSLNK